MWPFKPNNDPDKVQLNYTTLDFENDLKPLKFIIDLEITNYKFKLNIDKNRKFISDFEVITSSTEILTKVLDTISKEYRNLVLQKYISLEKQEDFISQFIIKELINIALSKNGT